MNGTKTRLTVLAVASTLTTLVAAPAAQATPYCGLSWGSTPEHRASGDTEKLNDIRAGRHACFDRLVIDLGGGDVTFGSYDARYVPVVHSDGSGDAVPVRGAADLQLLVDAPAHDDQGNPTFSPGDPREAVDVSGFATFRQVAYAGSYEGRTTIALGVRARLPFRVFTVSGTPRSDDTPRLVIDVAHRW
jgi:hypothetical protein